MEEVRFERVGARHDLPAMFESFIKVALGGRAIDDNFGTESANGKIPDFGIYRDLVLIEMKHLETHQQPRVQSVLTDLATVDEMPIFYGRRAIKIDSGQPQATISFFEIDDIEGMKQRHQLGAEKGDGWKYPPAGCLR